MNREILTWPETWLAVVLVFAAAILGWQNGGDRLEEAGIGARGPISWNLPGQPASVADEAIRQVTARSIWGFARESKAPTKIKKNEEPKDKWRLFGIVAEDNGLYALLKPGTKLKAMLLGPGDSLPDGSVIEKIDETSITVVKQGKQVVYTLFGGNG